VYLRFLFEIGRFDVNSNGDLFCQAMLSVIETTGAAYGSKYGFPRDLGARIEGDPAALTRMPADIAEIADGMWQRALKLAGEAAAHDDNAARERLRQIELEIDIRRRSYEVREQEIDTQARERERALADARDQLLSLSKALFREQATNEAHARRIGDLETQLAQYRQQMAELIAGTIAQPIPPPPNRCEIHGVPTSAPAITAGGGEAHQAGPYQAQRQQETESGFARPLPT
jgi:hypothetical protein